eukprot:4286185-Pyramimonas_sp.AAC.1
MPTYFAGEQQAQWFFLGYQKHKSKWRRCMKKPVRKVRRIVRRALKRKRQGSRRRSVTSGKPEGCQRYNCGVWHMPSHTALSPRLPSGRWSVDASGSN